jgi:hypothetical protein
VLTDNFLTAALEGEPAKPNTFLDVTVAVNPDGSLTASRI